MPLPYVYPEIANREVESHQEYVSDLLQKELRVHDFAQRKLQKALLRQKRQFKKTPQGQSFTEGDKFSELTHVLHREKCSFDARLVSQHVCEACGQKIPITKNIPGPSSRN